MNKLLLFEPVGTPAPTATDTSLDAELAGLEAEHRIEEEKRVIRIRRINEIKRLQGKLPSRDRTKDICGNAD